MTGSAPSRLTAGWLVGLLCLIWGSTWLVIKIGLNEELPPFTSAGVRFVIAAIVMALIAPTIRRFEGGTAPPTWLWVTLGLTNFAASYGIVYWGETVLPSGLASVLWAVFPLLMAIGGHVWLHAERLGAAQWIGFALGFFGILVLFRTDLAKIGPEAIPAGLVFLMSPAVCVIGTIATKRHGSHCSSALLNRNACLVGAVLLCGLGGVFERQNPLEWSAPAWATIFYLAVIGTCLTFGLYFWLLRHSHATRLSLIAYITPPIALFLGWIVLDEPVYTHTLVGTLLIVLGVALVVKK